MAIMRDLTTGLNLARYRVIYSDLDQLYGFTSMWTIANGNKCM